MVDTQINSDPLSLLENDSRSPLAGELVQEMEEVQDISQSIGDNSSETFSADENLTSGNGPGSNETVQGRGLLQLKSLGCWTVLFVTDTSLYVLNKVIGMRRIRCNWHLNF